MHDLGVLGDFVILVGVAIPVVALAGRLRIPAIVGFLLAGVATGPHALALIGRADDVQEIAELGVVLLLFTIGLELTLSRVMKLGRELLQGGGLQLLGTLLLVAGATMAVGVASNRAVFYGALVALSSTAAVLRIYADRGELDTPHGRVVVGILLFQDLAVVPLILAVPALAGIGRGLDAGVLWDFLKGLGVVAGMVTVGRWAVPWMLDRVVLFKQRELFTLCIVFLGLAAAFTTASFGLSLALGAFLAGLIVSESDYGLQALSDILPFRDTFTGVFFISVGMLLDLRYIGLHPWLVCAAASGVLLLKGLVATAVVLGLRRDLRTSLAAGAALAQVGEFSFILANVGLPLGLFQEDHYELFLSASVITILLAPLVIAVSRPAALRLGRLVGLAPPLPDSAAPDGTPALRDHAIVVGHGLSGRHLCRVLEAADIPYVALEQNGRAVREAREAGVRIVFGDGTRREPLEHVGVERARALILAISSPADERRGVAVARELNPSLRIVVRTRYVREIDELMRLGATSVVVEEYEATLELFAHVLQCYSIPANTVRRELDALRSRHYGLLRDEPHTDIKLDALRHLGIHGALELVEIEDGSRAVGESPHALNLRRDTGATVIAVVRDGQAIFGRDPSFTFRAGDTAVLVGDQDALTRATQVFCSPRQSGEKAP
jgi:CPA2 family monovalent cation:H+ antiporter-2